MSGSGTKFTTEQDLLKAIKSLLNKSGHLNKLRAEAEQPETRALAKLCDARTFRVPFLLRCGKQLSDDIIKGVRANITDVLQHRQAALANPPPPLTEEGLIVNELVREYLEWNGYLYTSSVMMSEAAMPAEKKTRVKLCETIGVKDDEKSSALPLLTNIVTAYTERIKRKINKCKMDTNMANEMYKINKETNLN